MNELDVLLALFYASQEGNKVLLKRAKQLRAKLNHVINPRLFKNIIEAIDPVAMVNSTVTNYLAASKEPAEKKEYHGVAQINSEYVYVTLDVEDNDIAFATVNEKEVLELAAIKVTEEAELTHAMVNIKLYKNWGFSGLVHQFEIGDMTAYRSKAKLSQSCLA